MRLITDLTDGQLHPGCIYTVIAILNLSTFDFYLTNLPYLYSRPECLLVSRFNGFRQKDEERR